MENKEKHQGVRFNKGKLRYDLVNSYAQEQLVKVFTMGAEKYTPRNWEKGMSWCNTVASLERHLSAWKKGEDYDEESKLLHMSHVMWNAHALTAYYKLYPQGDDRPHSYLKNKKIGLDIDEVLCDWVGGWCKCFNISTPTNWDFDYEIKQKFEKLRNDNQLDEFYLNLLPKTLSKDIPFEPECYVTSRPVSKEITMAWLQKHNFPTKPVYNVELGKSKLEVIKEAKIDIFVDDKYQTFVELNSNGICCYLFDSPHNQQFNVGHKRIKNLNDLIL